MTTTRGAFELAIAAQPTDPVPRLVYADYLDESGERAEAIAQRLVAQHLPTDLPAGPHVFQVEPTENERMIARSLGDHSDNPVYVGFSEPMYALRSESNYTHHRANHAADRVRCESWETGRCVPCGVDEYTGVLAGYMLSSAIRELHDVREIAVLRDMCRMIGHEDVAARVWERAWDTALRIARGQVVREDREAAERAAARRLADAHARATADSPTGKAGQLVRGNVGYVRAVERDLRGTPGPGEIWYRRSRSGRWAKSAKVKFGRPLTAEELESMTPEACGV